MDLKSRSKDNVHIVELGGRLDAYEAPQVRTMLEMMVSTGQNRMLIDMSNVTFVDSTGLATFVQCLKRCRSAHGDLKLCCMQPPVKMTFEMTRLDRAFDIHPDLDSALSAFQRELVH